MYETVGIVGLGLLGGSLAKAFKNRIGVKKIVASNRNVDVLDMALKDGVIDEGTTVIDEKFADCDIVFICTPVDSIYPSARELSKYVKKGCVLTDVGSTKGNIYKNMLTLSDKIYFIGGHPMTGSEKFRYTASKEHLFENAYYIVAPSDNVPEEETEKFKSALKTIGALPVEVSPFEHDYVVAAISHVPHIIASCLVNNVKRLEDENQRMQMLAAGGFKDITRIASSSPEMWEGICIENKKEILKVLESYENTIHEFKRRIEAEDKKGIRSLLDEAKTYRDNFSNNTPGLITKRFEIVVDVLDRPGSIAVIAVLLSSNGVNIKNIGIVNSREEDAPLFISFASEDDREKSVRLLRGHNYDVHIK